ncbi:uncharacterized protein [Triticum aestivum]|uniref:uncharacterized protein isoform X1 n=1 Tax=Triticum aestivum TaxID=4565 RepID=UPI001D006FAA|nr:uncharacterized protein LOC123137378 isoform X1 [Triticum aestivum]XP_044413053.1 uncharacterized protein LOC123137378 isoform X1 [Triticum aestivum]
MVQGRTPPQPQGSARAISSARADEISPPRLQGLALGEGDAVRRTGMGCLFDCFRAAGGEPRAGRDRAQLVSSSVIPSPKVGGERSAPPSRNALSAVFLREDEGSQATSSGSDRDAGSKRVDPELMHEETAFNVGRSLENFN